MTPTELAGLNARLRHQSPEEIITWALAHAGERAIVSTNFRPYEAVLLHLATRARPDIPVLWADHGYNRPATYRHAERLRTLLGLNLKPYLPALSAAHYDAIYGGPPEPTPENEELIRRFSAVMKLEPFARGMRELAPTVWLTALRQSQNPNRAGLDIVVADSTFHTLKVSPLFHWSDADLEDYLGRHQLPDEWDYFDPAKADDKRECGLHAHWGADAVTTTPHEPFPTP
jgi:phosphoadenosine phosphosulfate reductase